MTDLSADLKAPTFKNMRAALRRAEVYATEYEFESDEGCHWPSDLERMLMLDMLNGLFDDEEFFAALSGLGSANDPTNLLSVIADIREKSGLGAKLDGNLTAEDRLPFVDQTILYDPAEGSEKGNCTEASVASILGLALDDVPNFRANGVENFWDEFHEFFRKRGYKAVLFPKGWQFKTLYLASGLSPRGAHHMVVMQDGKLVHDPHPSKAGIGEVDNLWLIVPIDPAARAALNPKAPS